MIIVKPGVGWKFQYGDNVQKVYGSLWRGKIVGFYSSSQTPVGYAVESIFEKGSVQIYSERALDFYPQKIPDNGDNKQ